MASKGLVPPRMKDSLNEVRKALYLTGRNSEKELKESLKKN